VSWHFLPFPANLVEINYITLPSAAFQNNDLRWQTIGQQAKMAASIYNNGPLVRFPRQFQDLMIDQGLAGRHHSKHSTLTRKF